MAQFGQKLKLAQSGAVTQCFGMAHHYAAVHHLNCNVEATNQLQPLP
jgi:hypothetical protein